MNKKTYTKQICVTFVLLLLLSLAGCIGNTEVAESEYHVYYLNKEETRIVEEPYAPESEDADALIAEYLELMAKEPERVEYRRLLQHDVAVADYSFDGGQLSLIFSEAYAKQEPAEEVLCRAAIVRTMLQIPEVTCVSFYIGDLPLSDSKGNVVGLMTSESFVENPGEQINAIQTADITLYFSNSAGDGLVEVNKEVQYSSNISMEKLVVEHLLEGPEDKELVSAIPSGTRLINVTTTNGVCYVNLDEGFLNQQYEIQEPIVIYSIVNSLSEISSVSKVQISVNGDTKGVYRDSFAFDTLYERNLDYVVNSVSDETIKGSETTVE